MSTYYELNKEEINKKRKEKYYSDSRVRNRAIQRAKARYERIKDTEEFKEANKIRGEKWSLKNKEHHKELRDKWMKENPNYYYLNNARARAKQFGVPFSLGIADLDFITIPETCPYLGIPIFKGSGGKSSENSPSLDRIIPSLGYVRGNVEFISARANRLKNDASLEELERIVNRLKTLIEQN